MCKICCWYLVLVLYNMKYIYSIVKVYCRHGAGWCKMKTAVVQDLLLVLGAGLAVMAAVCVVFYVYLQQ